MTKKELEQMRYIPGELRLLERELDNLPEAHDVVTGSRTTIPYDKHVIQIDGPDLERERYLRRKITALKDKQLRLERWVDTIEDSQMRQILLLRFRDGLSWQRVAFGIGHHDESYPRQKVDRFLKMTEKTEFPVL